MPGRLNERNPMELFENENRRVIIAYLVGHGNTSSNNGGSVNGWVALGEITDDSGLSCGSVLAHLARLRRLGWVEYLERGKYRATEGLKDNYRLYVRTA